MNSRAGLPSMAATNSWSANFEMNLPLLPLLAQHQRGCLILLKEAGDDATLTSPCVQSSISAISCSPVGTFFLTYLFYLE